MSEAEIAYMPATEMAAAIRAKRVSPVEIVATLLARIERLEPSINAFVHLDPGGAIAAAERAEQAVMRGDPLGPLHGVPITIKDLFWTRDMPTQYGSETMRGFRPSIDTPSVTRARNAGAVSLGKTTVSEFGWTGVSRSPLTGITHNPWRHGLNAGASSAGAGAAAAAGFGPLHQGSDGAGSIRMPSHFCGVFGLKPTYGRVPYHPVGAGDYTSHLGPMTRTVADAALLLDVMSGPSPLDHTTLDVPAGSFGEELEAGVRGRRVAFSPDLGFARVDPAVADSVARAARVFADDLGAEVETVTPPWASDGPELARLFWPAHLSRHVVRLREWETRMDPGLVACARDGARTTMIEYQLARERKYAYVAAIHAWFEDYDLLLTPAASVAAFDAALLMPADWPQHAWDWLSWAEFLYPFNMCGNPAASVPCGFTPDGLPVGLQIVGRRFDDAGVLAASAAFERARPWANAKPSL
ncbi:MAG TPA: amidase family protein [Acidisphaera sp.]|nr:amidase family protein [Acidisphaera sp.]